MANEDQDKPLAPTSIWKFRSEEDQKSISNHPNVLRQKRYVKLCGCAAAIFLIIAVTALILGFTVFNVKAPIVKFNAIDVQSLELGDNGILITDKNVTLVANVYVKNPNVASFKFGNTTTAIYYKGVVVGEGKGPPDVAKARSMRMNVKVDIIPSKILVVHSLVGELTKRVLTIDSYTKIDGRIKIAEVKLNCTMTCNISSREIHGKNCKRKVGLSI